MILAPYPLYEAPSQRFRFEHFLKFMEENEIEWAFQSFVSINGWKILYQPGHQLSKFVHILAGYFRRLKLIIKAIPYDIILIHRELTPMGPPVFEWTLAKVLRKKIIYDFDDAIWMNDGHDKNPIWKILKWRSKVGSICSWSWKVTTGNDFLATFAKQHCEKVTTLPTVVNTEIHKNNDKTGSSQRTTIGWTGSHSTLFYLDELLPVLQKLEQSFDFDFMVIANKNPELPLRNFRFIKWNATTEIEDLSQIDIGVMPLEDSLWAQGKCGFKLIQYLSMGMAAVASPVGANAEVILNEQTGLHASTPAEWLAQLTRLLTNESLQKQLGDTGRTHIKNHYSVASRQKRFFEVILGKE